MENAIIYEVHWWKCYLIARKLFVFIILRSHGSELPSRIQSWIANNKIARNDMRDFFSNPLFTAFHATYISHFGLFSIIIGEIIGIR